MAKMAAKKSPAVLMPLTDTTSTKKKPHNNKSQSDFIIYSKEGNMSHPSELIKEECFPRRVSYLLQPSFSHASLPSFRVA